MSRPSPEQTRQSITPADPAKTALEQALHHLRRALDRLSTDRNAAEVETGTAARALTNGLCFLQEDRINKERRT